MNSYRPSFNRSLNLFWVSHSCSYFIPLVWIWRIHHLVSPSTIFSPWSSSRILNRIFPFTEIKEGSPTPDELEGLSDKISDKWKKLGRRLQFDKAQITEHDKNNDKLSEKAYDLLMTWKERDASDATYRVLHKALSDVKRKDLAQEFCCQWKRYYHFLCIIELLPPDIEKLNETC